MAKQLAKPPPSSSVARLFDLGAAARAVSSIHSDGEPAAQFASSHRSNDSGAVAPAAQRLVRKKLPKREVVLTAETDEAFSSLVGLYRRATGTKVTASHVARAILKGAAHCMHYLEREARHLGPMPLPSNALGHELERERFEARLADAFIAGIRSSPAMERDP